MVTNRTTRQENLHQQVPLRNRLHYSVSRKLQHAAALTGKIQIVIVIIKLIKRKYYSNVDLATIGTKQYIDK